jgi:hypothetical protein
MDSKTIQKLDELIHQKIEAERKLSFWNLRYHTAEKNCRKYPYSSRRRDYFDLVKDRVYLWSQKLEHIKRQLEDVRKGD